MSDTADQEGSETETFHDRPAAKQLTTAIGVLIGAGLGALIAGPGFGLLVLTVSALATALWIAYAVP